MANGKTHLVVGGLTGLAVALADHPAKSNAISHHPLTAVGVGAFFGKLPDTIEPSLRNPHHRQFFHSIAFLSATGYAFKKAYNWESENDWESLLRGFALVATGAYISHLVVDSFSSRSLPVIGKL
ncbi:MAG: metal-dependent hydrolase [Gammaproteobacteria bacterium]|nr:metal-dependent hydrolase [Gammaproteobacteria bacterium]MCF6231424.1 metal-dependent hydrolase [Gammaproteobacteria bacterium]